MSAGSPPVPTLPHPLPAAFSDFERAKEAVLHEVARRLTNVFPPNFTGKLHFLVDSGRVSVHTITLEVRAKQKEKRKM